jgi:putative SOS response-associated peptidase YedK
MTVTRSWALATEYRPAGSFCEYADTKPRKTPTWFALDDSRPLAAFAGVWTPWHGTRGTKANPVVGEHQLFGFLTTEANAEVGAIHPKAMPVILTTQAQIEHWMTAPAGSSRTCASPWAARGTSPVLSRNPLC